MKPNLKDLLDRVKMAEEIKNHLLDIETRFLRISPILSSSIEQVTELLDVPSIASPQTQDDIRRSLSLLLEELRAIVDEVEGETESLEAKVDAIESLQYRFR
ncbi:MAG: hypothetical protein EAX95_09525 [Candidatus Thorarchaeota archaeon]|nr:hypothetical protein [Candidatus Thorarchaeota archaeon]